MPFYFWMMWPQNSNLMLLHCSLSNSSQGKVTQATVFQGLFSPILTSKGRKWMFNLLFFIVNLRSTVGYFEKVEKIGNQFWVTMLWKIYIFQFYRSVVTFFCSPVSQKYLVLKVQACHALNPWWEQVHVACLNRFDLETENTLLFLSRMEDN